MQVLIMRHGEAALEAASDSARPLTQCGRDESHQMAVWLNAKPLEIDRVLVSPYLRAEQTLATLRTALALPAGEEVLPELTPGGDAALVTSYLQALAKKGLSTVLVVSHLPLVGYLVAELCPGECPPMFATSAVAGITLDADTGRGTFDWQLSPAQVLARA